MELNFIELLKTLNNLNMVNDETLDLSDDDTYAELQRALNLLDNLVDESARSVDDVRRAIESRRFKDIQAKVKEEMSEEKLDNLIDEFLTKEYKGIDLEKTVLENAIKVLKAYSYFIIDHEKMD